MEFQNDIVRGDVYIVDIDETLKPYLVVQNNAGNKYAPTTIAVPIVQQNRMLLSYIPVTARNFKTLKQPLQGRSMITWEPRTIDKIRLREYVGTLSRTTMEQINLLGEENLNLEESEVRWVNLTDAKGSEQGGRRPCLVTKNKNGSIIAIPVTNAIHEKKVIPTHMVLDKEDFVDINRALGHKSILLWEQQRRVRDQDLLDIIGRLNQNARDKAVSPAKISVGLARVGS